MNTGRNSSTCWQCEQSVCMCVHVGDRGSVEDRGAGRGGVYGPLECKHRDIPAVKYSSAENRSLEGMVVI